MSDLRTAAQQTLNYWESASFGDAVMVDKMDALRAALAQQDEPLSNQCGETCERAKLCAVCASKLAEPVEPVATVAENATTQQRVVETPPSDYRRGYWDGFNIGKREGRIEAEDALAQQDEPVTRYSVDQPLNYMTRCADGTEFINTVVMPAHAVSWAYTTPPQRKPLTKESLLYIYNQLPNWGMDMDSLPQGLEKFARAVERAHGIKE